MTRASRAAIESWPLRWKVAATLVLPILLAATFGAVRIYNELSAASRLNLASDNAVIVVPAVELVDRLDGLAYAAASGAPLEEPLAQFDESAKTLDSLIKSAEFDQAVAAQLTTASSTAKTLRDDITSGPLPQQVIADRASDVASGVVSVIAETTETVDDRTVRPLADQLVDTLAAQRALTTQRVLIAAPDFADSDALRAEVADAAGAEAAAIDRLTRLTPTDEATTLSKESDVRRHAYTQASGDSVYAPAFTDAMRASGEAYRAMTQRLASDLDGTLHHRANALRSDALRDTAIILGAVLAALVFALAVGRSLIRSIGRLRQGALQVAQVELPEEIERLSKGGGMPEIQALPFRTNEEVGQLARAIDDIHSQAVRLASEHGVRLQIGDMFETLSRRSRSLVEEQLALIETLELDEEDPVRLDHLFRLDHLATRMRRNGDNLLVLADTVERHRQSPPVALPDMLRAAMSEVEEYRRVQVGHMADVSIAGSAASDIGHLIAELLDNALRYSPPDSPVMVTVGRAVDAGLLVEVADRGLGMSKEDLTAANERLALGGEVTSETAKRMGLFVVGRLARRHEATVRLRTTSALTERPGVTASVHLPGTLVSPIGMGETLDELRTGSFTESRPRPSGHGRGGAATGIQAEATGSPTASPHTERRSDAPVQATASGLPKRSPGASGVNGAPAPANGLAAPAPAPEEPERQQRGNPLSYFTSGNAGSGAAEPATPEPAPARESSWVDIETESLESAPIFERMASEWLMDPTAPESRNRVWSSAADAGWAAAAKAVEQEPKRHTASGLPIRERGARLVPDEARSETQARADGGNDPAAIRDVLSRQLAGVRRGRAETDAAHSRIEGDR
ncbi:ATP-binding protein [Mycolicibacterium neworleansense]|uniref:histidine kinase n=1 Tax=Mycolicibacterium neworleansense TaxID=146018 RepID=A0A0H5RUW4_9MYCO|nr:ATP-binding protein [Mycolicibacterium neworleansense]MCV7360080.1 sensor histidine kinase [Mycolicibacterium neworleansense]CRZ17317.1 signal transduction histidine kinase [Mycolicibacterium neworleansense]